MTVVTRKRSGDFAMIPNAVANDERLSFETRGLLCYLLAKPHDWRVQVKDIQKVGSVGRDKAYRMLQELRAAGYLTVTEVRGPGGKFVEYNYVIYDVAIPEHLPLPEKPEPGEPLTEKAEAATPLPEKPLSGSAVSGSAASGKHGRITNTELLQKHISRKPQFAALWEAWRPEHRPKDRAGAERLFNALPTDADRDNAVACAASYHRLCAYRSQKPSMALYLRNSAFRELVGAPDFDRDGDFIITPDREEWSIWIADISTKYGEAAAQNAVKGGRLVRKTRWPENAPRQLSMPIATGTPRHG